MFCSGLFVRGWERKKWEKNGMEKNRKERKAMMRDEVKTVLKEKQNNTERKVKKFSWESQNNGMEKDGKERKGEHWEERWGKNSIERKERQMKSEEISKSLNQQ